MGSVLAKVHEETESLQEVVKGDLLEVWLVYMK